jgi:hypothetical protein
MKKRLIALFIVSPILLCAQLTDFKYSLSDSLKYNYVALKTTPFSLIDPVVSSFGLSAEYRHEQDYAIEAIYYFLIPQVYPEIEGKENQKLLRFKIEVRRYLNDNFYVAPEFSYSRFQYDFTNDYYVNTTDNKVHSYDFARIDRNIQSANVKIGWEFIFRKFPKIVSDFHFGVGANFINIQYKDVVNDQVVPIRAFPTAEGAEELSRNGDYDIVAHKVVRGNFTAGFRIGYKIWSKN